MVHRTRFRTRVVIALACLSAGQGCYTYVPRQPAAPVATGRRYQAELTDSGVVTMTSQLGPGVYLLDGRLIAANEQTITLAANTLTSRRTGIEQFWNGEPVVLPRSAVALLRERVLSKGRSAAVAALAAGAVAILYAGFSTRGFGVGGGGRGGGNGQ